MPTPTHAYTTEAERALARQGLTLQERAACERALRYVNEQFLTNPSEEAVAAHAGMGRAGRRLFRAYFGFTIRVAVDRLRVELAKQYLLAGHCVDRAAAEAGWRKVCVMARRFKDFTGLSPERWIDQQRRACRPPSAR